MHVLIQPGWQNSGPGHWQSRWEACLPASSRVAQADWDNPVLEDWVNVLHLHITAQNSAVLIACHSLGCIALAHWAARHPDACLHVAGVLLVAPADVERTDAPLEIRGFAPIPRQRLPFPCIVVASDDDPYAALSRSQRLADEWGARLHVLHAAGHINAEAGIGDWDDGLVLLESLRS